jgi:hypothetical protein
MRRALLALVMTVGLAMALATTAFAADVNGKWVGNVETPNGPIELTYEFKADGEMLTGTVASAQGSLPLNNGKIAAGVLTYDVALEGNVIKHEAKVNEAGTEITVKATGDWGTSEYVVKKVGAAAAK